MNILFEPVIARQVARIVPDLRLVDLPHYIGDMQHRRYSNIADIVDGACERYFHPLTLRFGYQGDFHLAWGNAPHIRLAMEFCNLGAFATFSLVLQKTCFTVELQRLSFDHPDAAKASAPFQVKHLQNAFAAARLTPPTSYLN